MLRSDVGAEMMNRMEITRIALALLYVSIFSGCRQHADTAPPNNPPRGCAALYQALAAGRIAYGDSPKLALEFAAPSLTEARGDYVLYRYHIPGAGGGYHINLVARSGALISAGDDVHFGEIFFMPDAWRQASCKEDDMLNRWFNLHHEGKLHGLYQAASALGSVPQSATIHTQRCLLCSPSQSAVP